MNLTQNKLTFLCLLLFSIGMIVNTSEAARKYTRHHDRIKDLPPAEQAQATIGDMDKDGDGTLSKDEVNWEFRWKRFDDVDTNSDGLVDQAELTKSYENSARARKMRAKRKFGVL